MGTNVGRCDGMTYRMGVCEDDVWEKRKESENVSVIEKLLHPKLEQIMSEQPNLK